MPWSNTCILTNEFFDWTQKDWNLIWNPFEKLEVPKLWGVNLDEKWREMGREKSLWTWFGLDLILNWRIDDLERDWLSPFGCDELSAPRLLQDLTIIDFVRCSMNIDQTCECTYDNIDERWCIQSQSRFGEFVQMTNWWPSLGVLMKRWTSALTVESQLVGTFDATNGCRDNQKQLSHIWSLPQTILNPVHLDS